MTQPQGDPARSKTTLIIGAVAAVVVVLGSITVWAVTPSRKVPGTAVAVAAPRSTTSPAGSTTSCVYRRASDRPVAKDVGLPANADRTPDTGTVSVVLKTDLGDIQVTLDREDAPCAVGSLLFLAGKKYFDGSPCHRLTVLPQLKVLQCGDPTGSGQGGPGYEFDDEPPTGLPRAAPGTVLYQRGTVAMANAGPDTNGSQFFLVYADTPLPPNYPVLGTYATPDQPTIDKVVAGGVSAEQYQEGDGKPNVPITIRQVIAER